MDLNSVPPKTNLRHAIVRVRINCATMLIQGPNHRTTLPLDISAVKRNLSEKIKVSENWEGVIVTDESLTLSDFPWTSFL